MVWQLVESLDKELEQANYNKVSVGGGADSMLFIFRRPKQD